MVTLGDEDLYYIGSISAGNDKIIKSLIEISKDTRKMFISGGSRDFSKALSLALPEAIQTLEDGVKGWKIPMSRSNLFLLSQLERKFPGLQSFSQFSVSEDGIVLVEGFDISDGIVTLSPILSDVEMSQFLRGLEVVVESQKYYYE